MGGAFATLATVARLKLGRVSDGVTATLDAWDPSMSIASGFAQPYGLLLAANAPNAIVVGNFSAIANNVDSQGNDIAGLDI